MSETQSPGQTTMKPKTQRRILLIAGGFFLLFGLYISVFMIPDTVRAMSGPQALTLAEAADVADDQQTYAEIQDGSWVCETLTFVEGYSPSNRNYGSPLEEETKFTEIFFTDDAREIVMFVTLSGEVPCDDLPDELPSGYLFAMSADTRQDLTNEVRLARFIEAETYLEFCGYCDIENSMIGAVFGVGSTLLGGGMMLLGRRIRVEDSIQ